ncbi:hypothetical protein HUJ04_001152 [Dendroctonus ponderosae]|nr:hypothetical protein HUJ04_001152 [Dendroctonus ponderosae]
MCLCRDSSDVGHSPKATNPTSGGRPEPPDVEGHQFIPQLIYDRQQGSEANRFFCPSLGLAFSCH